MDTNIIFCSSVLPLSEFCDVKMMDKKDRAKLTVMGRKWIRTELQNLKPDKEEEITQEVGCEKRKGWEETEEQNRLYLVISND